MDVPSRMSAEPAVQQSIYSLDVIKSELSSCTDTDVDFDDDAGHFPCSTDGQLTRAGSLDELAKRLAKIKSDGFLNANTAVLLAYILTCSCVGSTNCPHVATFVSS